MHGSMAVLIKLMNEWVCLLTSFIMNLKPILRVKNIVLKGLAKGLFYQKEDNSVWCNLESEGLDHKLLVRGDGTTVYMTQDVGTAVQRFEDYPKMTQAIYTVGDEQDYHFKVLFKILEKLGYSWAPNCQHLSYGMVDLPYW